MFNGWDNAVLHLFTNAVEERVDPVATQDDAPPFRALRRAVGHKFNQGYLEFPGGAEAVATGFSSFRRAVDFAHAGGGEFFFGEVSRGDLFEFFDGVGLCFCKRTNFSGVSKVQVSHGFRMFFREVYQLGDYVFVEIPHNDCG